MRKITPELMRWLRVFDPKVGDYNAVLFVTDFAHDVAGFAPAGVVRLTTPRFVVFVF